MLSHYRNKFLDLASKLDAMLGERGDLVENAKAFADNEDEASLKMLLNIVNKNGREAKPQDNIKRFTKELLDSLYKFCGCMKIQRICANTKDEDDGRSLSELMTELNSLVGLERVKAKVRDLIDYQKVRELRDKHGFNNARHTLHLAFMGKPGTGKTTVARIVGRIYKQIGLLSKGHFIEVSRTDLIAGYQGQTALKVKGVLEKAKGGVLFIDEAYSITENEHADSYGRECLTELTKALEDYRGDLAVIVAGYTQPMIIFFESNPGLKSRFNTFIDFDDYSADELEAILTSMCASHDYKLTQDALDAIKLLILNQVNEKDDHFANGRLVRNMYEDVVMNHARRVARVDNPSKEALSLITGGDIPRHFDAKS